MKQIVVISGKGGVGKTSLVASFARILNNVVVADCDVDAPNLHMLLHPEIFQTIPFQGSQLATIDTSKCTACGQCREACRFAAVTSNCIVDPLLCEGCGVCALVCPTNAITLVDRNSGVIFQSKYSKGLMVHAQLDPGEANSGKLVTMVRAYANRLATENKKSLVLLDGPPGIGCPAIASITDVDAALVVTEPTLSGIHDFQRVLELLAYFGVTPFICINRCNIDKKNTQEIIKTSRASDSRIIGELPFNPVFIQALEQEQTVIEYDPHGSITKMIENMWRKLLSFLDER